MQSSSSLNLPALIRTPSLSGQEEQVARLIQKTMLQEGFDEAVIDRYGSVLGCIRGNRPGKTVLLDGHIDTVDLSDRSLWQHDPYGAELVDGKIYGRGTSDMKGGVAAMVMAAAGFAKAHSHDFSGTIYVSARSTRSALRASPPGISPSFATRTA